MFRVRRDATKPEIKAAVELMFEVKVEGVQVVNVAGQGASASAAAPASARTARRPTCASPQGQTIDFAGVAK